jgi:hypothetical protein
MQTAISPSPAAKAEDASGVAMLEFVLILPFVWIVLVLVLNAGQVFLERQRTFVAVREVGIRHTAQFSSNPDAEMAPYAADVVRQVLLPRRMTAVVGERGEAGECPRDGQRATSEPLNDAFKDDVLGLLRGFQDILMKVSSSRSYEIRAQGPPMAGGLMSRRVYRACFAIDGGPWTNDQTGGPLDWLKSLIGEIADKIF